MHYTGWLASGKEFDCSRRRGAPATFAVGQVIEGWNEGLALMTPGARFKLTIPSKLGYGARGYPPTIPADATLVFDVELLSIEPAPDFRKPDAANAVKLDSDLVYEVLVPGAGEVPGVDVQLELAFTFWTAAGKLLHDSRNMGGTKWASANSLRLGVLVEAAKTMKPDEVWVCEVPPTLAFGDQKMGPDLPAGSTTIWRVKMVRTFVEPAFKLPDDGELKQTDSGLQYLMLREGKGRSPRMGESVTVHYAGWLTDGTPFDSSYARTSARFQLGGVIQGWNEGLQLMKPGGRLPLRHPRRPGLRRGRVTTEDRPRRHARLPRRAARSRPLTAPLAQYIRACHQGDGAASRAASSMRFSGASRRHATTTGNSIFGCMSGRATTPFARGPFGSKYGTSE